MTRYIDADKFLKKIERYSLSNGTSLGKHSGIADEIIDILQKQPTADVVEVVRCLNCRYWNEGDLDPILERRYGTCYRPLGECGYAVTDEFDYCSFGERK